MAAAFDRIGAARRRNSRIATFCGSLPMRLRCLGTGTAGVRHYIAVVPDARFWAAGQLPSRTRPMPFYYPLHLRERFERMHRQRIADVDRVKAFAARHLAESLAPPLIPI